MIYKVYMSNGQPLAIEASKVQTDPNTGTQLLDGEGNIVAFFYSGQVSAVFPENTVLEAEVVKKVK